MVVVTDPEYRFHYLPTCTVAGCSQPPVAKIAAIWSHGPLAEFKNYGLACGEHRDHLLASARERRQALAVSDDEQVGPVEVVPLGGGTGPIEPPA